jgi:ferritin-like metal-binding protein YciE
MAITNLKDAFFHEMEELLGAEEQIAEALQAMMEKASHEDLKIGFEHHLKQGKTEVERLQETFESLDHKPQARRCSAIDGIIEQTEDIFEQTDAPDVRDAMLIAAAQKIEHLEIATYGTLATWAEVLGFSRAAELLKMNLSEEKETDEALTQLAREINREAQPAR